VPLNSTMNHRMTVGLVAVLSFLWWSPPTFAESPSPTVHWGGLAFPDQFPGLELGFTANRFTEFDGDGRQFNNTQETMGLNFGTVSWTHFWKPFPGLSTNVTLGAGPSGEEPTQSLQNDFLHEFLFNIPTVPVGQTRDEFDFMIDGSITQWKEWNTLPLFLGAGFSTGTLYHEVFVLAGFRRFPFGTHLAELMGTPSTGFSAFVNGFK